MAWICAESSHTAAIAAERADLLASLSPVVMITSATLLPRH